MCRSITKDNPRPQINVLSFQNLPGESPIEKFSFKESRGREGGIPQEEARGVEILTDSLSSLSSVHLPRIPIGQPNQKLGEYVVDSGQPPGASAT